jgi:4-azaleucine resistance transporter AzlC
MLRAALKDSTAVGLACLPMGLAFGVLVAHSTLPWWWASVFATIVFAGSLEFLLLGLVTSGASLPQVALAALLVNARHVFYALTFPLHRVPGRLAKAYSTFALTDEAYALAKPHWSRGRILTLQALIHVYWVSSVTVGALTGALLPARVTGLGFAVTALFLGLGLDAVRSQRDALTPLVAAACALLAHWLFPREMLVVAMALFTGYVLLRYAVSRA